MANSQQPTALAVAPATPADAATIRAILEDVQRWLADRGVVQWTAPFTDEWIARRIATGEFHVVRLGETPVATFRLLWADPHFWGDREQGDAAYIHTMAVRREYAGQHLGARIVQWAEGQARARGRPYLRLDYIAENRGLGIYYRGLGFTPLESATVSTSTVTLLEKELGS